MVFWGDQLDRVASSAVDFVKRLERVGNSALQLRLAILVGAEPCGQLLRGKFKPWQSSSPMSAIDIIIRLDAPFCL